MATRPGLDDTGLNTGKKARLHRILYQHGLRNGTALFLPYDQGLEHGPRDFFRQPGRRKPPIHHATRPARRVQRDRHSDRSGREVLLGLRRRDPTRAETERQDGDPPDDEALSP